MRRNFRLAISLCLHFIVSGAAAAGTVHVLSRGETLYSLARHYGVTVANLLEENGIADPSALAVGTKLSIPDHSVESSEKNTAALYHQVTKGDTYYGIARRYGLTVEELQRLNKRSVNHVLSIGERLKVGSSAKGMVQVNSVPWWPVSGIKRPLEGKLKGISIQADSMSYVHAVAAGSVVWTGPYRGFGNVVLIDSGGYIYLYGGNDDLFVNVGQSVDAGSRIGRLGSSGPDGKRQYLYFSVFNEGVPVSPEDAPRG